MYFFVHVHFFLCMRNVMIHNQQKRNRTLLNESQRCPLAFRESLAAVTAQYWPEFVKKVGKPPSYTINGFSGHLKWAHQLENVSHVGLPHETGREAIFVFMTNARNSYTILSKHFKSSHV